MEIRILHNYTFSGRTNIALLNKNLVFIADRIVDHSHSTLETRSLEMLADTYFYQVEAALNKIAPSVTYYPSPDIFLDNIANHKNDIVLSLWSGTYLRSRRAIIPSICEAYGIAYVGADPYIQTICADKHLSKTLCSKYGIKTAKDVVLSSEYEFPMLRSLQFPVVVKPNFEGGSIGIFNENLADNYDDAVGVCKKLLPHFKQLLVEEYVAGEEVSVCVAGIGRKLDTFQVVRVAVNNKTFFEHYILGAEAKKMGQAKRTRDIITKRFPSTEKEKIISLFRSLGKVEVIRFDGRLNGNNFTMIELTPDCSFSATGSMSNAFFAEGYSYEEMLEILCQNAIRNQESEYRSANT